MTSSLAVVEPPHIRVTLTRAPSPEHPCEALPCDLPRAGHVLWLSPDWSAINTRDVCAMHVGILRELGGCMTFPLGGLPAPEVVIRAVRVEHRRRSAAAQAAQMAARMNTWLGTSTTLGGFTTVTWTNG